MVKRFHSLAFVPSNKVIETFEELVASLDPETDELLGDFLVYFETTWIGINQRGRRRRPLYDIDLWNVHDRVQDDLPRTNNSIEGWHRAFDQRVGITHPTIRRLVNKIRKEQANNEITLVQLSAGVSVRLPKKRYQALNMRLKEIVGNLDLNAESFLNFLRAIAHNL